MGRPPLGKKAMTPAQRQQRYRDLRNPKSKLLWQINKQQLRAKRERELAEATIAASQRLGEQLFGVLYVDPPWDYLVRDRFTGMDRHAANHYPAMSLAKLAALKLPAAKDCVLYLWTTSPMLANAMALLSTWGFTYKSWHGWPKPGRQGTGHWNRENFELLLVATRGRPAAPAPGQQMPSWIEAPRGKYSEKPDIFAEWIERVWPHTPKLEMFARRRRDGWGVWGNEVEDPGVAV